MAVKRIEDRKKSKSNIDAKPIFNRQLKEENENKEKVILLASKIEIKDKEIEQLNTKIKDLNSSITQVEKDATSKVDSVQQKLGVSESKISQLTEELKTRKTSIAAPEKMQITKVGRAILEDDGLIHIACKIKFGDTITPVTLFGSVAAFNGMSQKAQQAEGNNG